MTTYPGKLLAALLGPSKLELLQSYFFLHFGNILYDFDIYETNRVQSVLYISIPNYKLG